jgi:pimeloyl-ACP methyl ester carboxylesterase
VTNVWLQHNRVRLALHHLRAGVDGGGARPLLCLHGLGERTAGVPAGCEAWPGPIWGLDLTGHGASSVPRGGGYTAEILMADVDAALAHLGSATVHGRGLGGYIALLIAGARADLVCGAIVGDGPGLAGGGTEPGSPVMAEARSGTAPSRTSAPDPFALLEMAQDVRPPDYATTFVRLAVTNSELTEPITVCAVVHPPWLLAALAEPGVVAEPLTDALARYAAVG